MTLPGKPRSAVAAPALPEPLWYDVNAYFRRAFGGKVWKVLLNTGEVCPHRRATGGCTFCHEETILPDSLLPVPPLAQQIALGQAALRRKYGQADRFVAYFQRGTALAAPPERLQGWLAEVAAQPGCVAAALSARPESVNAGSLAVLESWGRKLPLFVDIGLQSASDAVLGSVNRAHGAADFARAIRQLAATPGVLPVAHLIVGLPGEDRTGGEASFRFVGELPVHGVKIHHLQVLRGSPLEREWAAGRVQLLDPAAFVERLADGLERLPSGVVIHRLLGDQPRKWVLAPDWRWRKETVVARLTEELQRRGTRQGARARGPAPAQRRPSGEGPESRDHGGWDDAGQ